VKFNIEDRVYYISGRHNIGSANPLKGTEFECKGIVKSIPPNALIVHWENGTSNVYSEIDLELAEGQPLGHSDPNVLFRARTERRK